MLKILFEAFLIGLAIAAPIGPINMICIQKTLELGMPGAITVGLAAACADLIYSLVAALGITAISFFLQDNTIIIKLIGGIFLLYLAYGELKTQQPASQGQAINHGKNLGKLGIKVFFLTLASPMTILSFIAIFASLEDKNHSLHESLIMVAGIFLGSISWSLTLGAVIVKIKHRLPKVWLQSLRYISAVCIGGFGLWVIYSSFID